MIHWSCWYYWNCRWCRCTFNMVLLCACSHSISWHRWRRCVRLRWLLYRLLTITGLMIFYCICVDCWTRTKIQHINLTLLFSWSCHESARKVWGGGGKNKFWKVLTSQWLYVNRWINYHFLIPNGVFATKIMAKNFHIFSLSHLSHIASAQWIGKRKSALNCETWLLQIKYFTEENIYIKAHGSNKTTYLTTFAGVLPDGKK